MTSWVLVPKFPAPMWMAVLPMVEILTGASDVMVVWLTDDSRSRERILSRKSSIKESANDYSVIYNQ